MTGKQNNSIVEIQPNELVQHKNKFKSIAIYKEEQYESTVELINENYKEQALTLSTSPDDNDANKLYVTAELAKDPKGVVSYEWKVLGVDGVTDLVDTSNFNVQDEKLTIINQWDIKKFITIQAFAYSDGIYIASSDILTVYEKDANLISAITVDFSKDHVVIPEGIADSASIQTLTTTTVTVYRGEDNITSTCKYIWSTKDGSSTNLVNSNQESAGGNVNGIKEFTNDTDELKVRIEVPKTTTLEGSIILEKIMPISRGGNVVYSIIPSTGVINITKMNIEQDYTFTMQQLTTAGGATTLEVLPTGHSLAWQYINKNGVAIGNKTPIGTPTSGVWTFKYNPNFEGAAGFSIILNDSQGDIVDSEQITFIQDGVDYTGLILAASSQIFSTSDPSTATITLTAQLYGDLVGETVSWYFGDNTTPDASGSSPYVLGIDRLSGKTSLKVRAEAGNGKYSDTITIYKLNDAITAFFTNELMTFSADALGMVGSQNSPVAFTSNVKIFQGTTDVTNKITNISLTSTNNLSNVVITPAYPIESDPKIVPSVTISAKGTNFGTSEITSGKFSFTITVDGIGNIPLDLNWIKIPAPNGINNIEEYYQATATNESPNLYSDANNKIIDTSWKTTIVAAGQTKEKPYLWNFERITKDNGDLLRDTDVSLLSSSPRTIVSTTEYYTTNTTGVIPAGATYNDTDTEQTGNDAPKIDGTVWETVEPTLAQGEYLYNFEVVQYAAVDADNKNLYTWTEPVQMGYAGEDGSDGEGIKYKYCLTNSATKPDYPAPANATYMWTDEPKGVSESNQYEYVISIITSPIVTVAKKIDTELREYDEEAWKRYGATGHEENWTIRGTGPFDNSHIHLQDYAYVEGTLTDSNPVQSVKLYGRVIGLTQSSTSGGNVRMRSEFLMVGDQITSDVALWAKWGNDGVDYTALIISGPQTFIKNPNVNDNPITPTSVTLTPNLYGDLVGKTVTWKQGTTTITSTSSSSNIYKSGNNLIVKSSAFGTNNTLTFTASVDGTSYNDDYSVYLLSEGVNGNDAYSAYLTDQSWSFSADKDGKVAANVEKTTTVKIFKGITEITTGVGITKVEGTLKNTLYGVFTYSNTSPTLTFKSNNSNLGSNNSQDGQITITAMADGKEFTLGLSWDKTNTGATGATGADGANVKQLHLPPKSYGTYSWQIDATIGREVGWSASSKHDDDGKPLYDNSHIHKGDTGYFQGTVNDKYSAKGVYQTITIYGEVLGFDTGDGTNRSDTFITNNESMRIILKTTSAQWGGTIGEQGIQGPDGEFVYLLPSTISITKTGGDYSPSSITLDMMKKSGDNAPVSIGTTGFKYSLFVDGEAEGEKQDLPSSLDITGLNANQSIVITIYDSSNNKIDVKTIDISPEALAEYVLYNDNTALTITEMTTQKPPVHKNYAAYLATVNGKEDKDDNGWYCTQTSNSVWQSKKSAYPSTQPTTSWGAPMRISGVLTNYTDLYNALDAETKKEGNTAGEKTGIYAFEFNGEQKIGINADVIRSGAIKIGSAEKAEDNKFYADMDPNKSVYIAGWKVNSGSLTNSDETVSLTPNGTSVTVNQTAIDGVVINANDKFAVTKDGKVYATAGKIGDVSIGDIASIQANPNLLIGSHNNDYWVEYIDGIGFSNLSGNSGEYYRAGEGFMYFRNAQLKFELGKTYTLSFDIKTNAPTTTTNLTIFETGSKAIVLDTTPIESISTTYQRLTKTFKVNNVNGTKNACTIGFIYDANDQDILYIRNIKLEEGNKATAWSLAPEDNITEKQVTTITKDTVSTETIIAKNLTAGYIQSDNYMLGRGTESALDFTLVGDHYKIGLKSTGIPSEVLIPESYNGKPVTELDVESFAAGKDIIKKLAIPASITTHPFGLLKDYTELVELHIPVHQTPPNSNVDFINLSNYFGSVSYGDLNTIPPLKIEKIYLIGSENNNTIPDGYFDFENWVEHFNFYIPKVYITPSIPLITPESVQYASVNEIYYYNDTQINFTEEKISKTNKIYKYPSVAIEGFCITSKEDCPMIDSPNFRVAQDGTIYAKAGMIGRVAIDDIGVKAETIQSSDYEENITGFKITSVQDENMINSPHFKVTQDGVVTAKKGDIAGWQIDGDKIYKDGVGMLSGDMAIDSLLKDGGKSPIRFFSGSNLSTIYINVSDAKITTNNISGTASLSSYQPINCNDVSASVVVKDGLSIDGTVYNITELDWSYDVDSYQVSFYGKISDNAVNAIKLVGDSNKWYVSLACGVLQDYNFTVLEDGSLYSSAAYIEGDIYAGKIGDWEITQGRLFGGKQEAEYIELSPSGGLTIQALDPLSFEEFDDQPDVTITKSGDVVNIALPENCTAISIYNLPTIEAFVLDDADNVIYEFNWINGENNMNILASNLGDNVDINTLQIFFIDAKFRKTHTEYNSVVSITPNGIAQFREIRVDRYYDTQGTLLFEVMRGGVESESVYFKAVASQGPNKNTVVELTPYSDSNYSIPSKASFGTVYMECWSTVWGKDEYEYLIFNLTGVSSAKAEMKYVPNRCTIRFYNQGKPVSYDLTLIDSVKPIFVGACGTREYESTDGTKLKFHVPIESQEAYIKKLEERIEKLEQMVL